MNAVTNNLLGKQDFLSSTLCSVRSNSSTSSLVLSHPSTSLKRNELKPAPVSRSQPRRPLQLVCNPSRDTSNPNKRPSNSSLSSQDVPFHKKPRTERGIAVESRDPTTTLSGQSQPSISRPSHGIFQDAQHPASLATDPARIPEILGRFQAQNTTLDPERLIITPRHTGEYTDNLDSTGLRRDKPPRTPEDATRFVQQHVRQREAQR